MNEYQQQAVDFLKKCNASMCIEYAGRTLNPDWGETQKRNFYNITITTPRGKMEFVFWDSIHNTEISQMTVEQYKSWLCRQPGHGRGCSSSLKLAKAEARPNEYDILACLTKYNPGAFDEFCSEYGYDEDSRRAEQIYFNVLKEYRQLERIFTPEQMEEMQEIN